MNHFFKRQFSWYSLIFIKLLTKVFEALQYGILGKMQEHISLNLETSFWFLFIITVLFISFNIAPFVVSIKQLILFVIKYH